MAGLARRGVAALLPRLLRAGGRAASPALGPGGALPGAVRPRWLAAAVRLQEQVLQEEEPAGGATSRAWQELLDRKLYKIDMDVRKTGRALMGDLENVVNTIEKGGKCTSNQALLVLRCSGALLVDLPPAARTEVLARHLALLRAVPGLKFDISHYNAILKVHMENGNSVVASDFLAELEEAGMEPNRVTFQHLAGLYCQAGNIAGATTVLEHMKEQDMAISEQVFLGLLSAHCLNLDHAGVASTLEVMSASGLLVGPQAHALLAAGYGRAGAWDQVVLALDRAKAEDVHLDDADIFHVMVGCCRGGLQEQADQLMERLPKKAGFFQKMRNAVPQLVHAGGLRLAADIFLDTPTQRAAEQWQGKFILAAALRAEVEPAEVLALAGRMQAAGYDSIIETLLDAALVDCSKDYCYQLGNALSEEGTHPQKSARDAGGIGSLANRMLRRKANFRDDPEGGFVVVRNLRALGFPVFPNMLANDVVRHMIDLSVEVPSATVARMHRALPNFNYGELSNAMMRSLLYRKDEESMKAATNYLLNAANPKSLNPGSWSESLVQSYMSTGLTADLTTCLWACSRPATGETGKYRPEDVFGGFKTVVDARLEEGGEQEERLRDALAAVVADRLGMPGSLADRLGQAVPSLAGLAAEAAAAWEAGPDYWTEERTAAFMQKRKTQHLRGSGGSAHVSEYSAIPDSLPAMEEAQARMVNAGRVNKGLISSLINAYALSGQLDKCMATLQYGQDKANFTASMVNTDHMVKALVQAGRWQEARGLVQDTLEAEVQVFASTFANVLEAAALAGEYQTVLDMVTTLPPNRFVNSRNSNAVSVCHVYQQAGLEAELLAAKEALLATGWAQATDGRLHGSIVHSLLDRGDMAGVMEEVEKVAQEHKFIPAKQQVTKKLIELEDLDRLQKLLDLSIPLLGEEKSLYDLILSFLDLGRKVQAKKLLETPGLRYNQPSFTYMVNKFRNQGNIEALANLVTLSRGIFGCDRDFLYQQLVEACCQDAARVEDLWMEIQEEGHAPSDSLKLTIATALRDAGKEVPFEVPEEYVRTMVEEPAADGRRPAAVEPAVVQEIIAKFQAGQPSLDLMPEGERTELFRQVLAEPSKFSLAALVRCAEAALADTSLTLADLGTDTLKSLARSKGLGNEARNVLDSRGGSTEKERTPQPRGRADGPKRVRQEPRKDQEPRKAKKEPAVVQEIIELIEKKDFDSATKLIEAGLADKTLVWSINKVLTIFAKADRAAAIPATVIAQNLSEDLPHDPKREIRNHTGIMMSNLTQDVGMAACRQLYDALSETSQTNLSRVMTNCTKLDHFQNDDAAFLSLVQSDPAGQAPSVWMLNNQQLAAASPALLAALEAAATEGNMAAKVLLCKAAAGRGDMAALETSWRALGSSVETFTAVFHASKPCLNFMPEDERTELFRQVLTSKSTLGNLVKFTEAALAATSLTLADLETDTLKALARSRDLGTQANNVLESRRGSAKS